MSGKPRQAEPKTLWDAHQFLGPRRPEASAPVAVRVAFYREAARMYARVAEIDRGHHHEALYWATREREHAEQLERAAREGGRGAGGA